VSDHERLRRLSRRPSPATLISIVALFVALGGTGYAAVTLPRDSVGSFQLKPGAVHRPDQGKNSIDSSKVVNGSLLGADFKVGQLPAGPTGPSGPAGAPATALWAVVAAAGAMSRSSHVTSSEKVATGQYVVIFDRDVKACAFIGSLGGIAAESVIGQLSATRRSINPNGVFVRTYDSAGTATDRSFDLAVFC
jgi:hypothetical protein